MKAHEPAIIKTVRDIISAGCAVVRSAWLAALFPHRLPNRMGILTTTQARTSPLKPLQNRVSLALPCLPEAVAQQGVSLQKKDSSIIMMIGIFAEGERYSSDCIANEANVYVLDTIKRVPGAGQAQIMGAPLKTESEERSGKPSQARGSARPPQ
jgi:hypothetical protein